MIPSEGHQTSPKDEPQEQHYRPSNRTGLISVVLAFHVPQQCSCRFLTTVSAKEGCVGDEEEEGFVVPKANAAIGEPGTVVVHTKDASVAGRTVVGTIRFGSVAFGAPSGRSGGFDPDVGSFLNSGAGNVRESLKVGELLTT